ncbi:MAG TPA: hypothetical protein VKC60_12495, partial [Opitutaceae bacterium]|nr:hypothetical protein [Opitutaceae bacterium]
KGAHWIWELTQRRQAAKQRNDLRVGWPRPCAGMAATRVSESRNAVAGTPAGPPNGLVKNFSTCP